MKKRNLFLLVCIMLVAVLTLVSCGGKEEHEHTYDTTKYVGDANNHWYGASCEHTDEKLNVAPHADADKNGVCDTCEYVTCTHTFDNSKWTADAENHWHAATCGCNVKGDVAAHVDADKNGVCDTCEYVTCTHTASDEWSTDEQNHWHAVTCGCELVLDKGAHADENLDGKCDTCEYVVCAHTFEEDWSNDVFNHWHAATCGCNVKDALAAHVDEDKDGDCDVCGFVCEHPYSEEWSYDNTQHWHDAICDHEVEKGDVAEHYDMNRDGACDACGYVDETHEHTWELIYNGKQHYYYSTCEHVITKDFEDHVDEDEDGLCDTCDAYVGGLADLVDSTTSAEAAGKVNGGTFIKNPESEWSETINYTFYKNYLTYSDNYSSYFISTYTKGGVELPFKVIVYDGAVEFDSYATDLEILKGPHFGVMYNSIEGYGVENLVYALYEYAHNELNTVYDYLEYYDSEEGVYAFHYVVETKTEYVAYIYTYDVAVSVTDGVITAVAINSNDYPGGSYLIDEEKDICIIFDDATASYSETLIFAQTTGERADETNPHAPENYLLTDFKLEIGVKDEWGDATSTGVAVVDGDTYTIAPGYSNGLTFVLPEADAHKASFNTYEIVTDMTTGWQSYPIFIYAENAGTFPVTIKCGELSISFTVVVNYTAPTALEGAYLNDYYEKEPVTELSTFPGVSLTLCAIPNESTASPVTIASVTAGDPDCVTLDADGNNWVFSATETGVYTITLTSDMDENVSCSIVISVSEPPSVADILNGNYSYQGFFDGAATVVFTPDAEGATTGTVTIKYDLDAFGNSVHLTETATYAVEGTEVILTHVEGDGIEPFDFIITETYSLLLCVYPDSSNPMWSYELPIESEVPGGEGGEGGDVTTEPDGTAENPFVIEGSGSYSAFPVDAGYIHYTYVAETDGDFILAFTGDDYWLEWGTDNFNYNIDLISANPAKITLTAGQTLYIKVSTNESYDGTVAVPFEVTVPGGAVAPSEVTLDYLAGNWSGASNSSVMEDPIPYSFTFNADGTGSGSYELFPGYATTFTFTTTIDGNTVTLATSDQGGKAMVFTYADGTLTCNECLMTGALSITKDAESGDNGDVAEGPSLEELAGEWTGTEVVEDPYYSMTAEYVITINADGTGSGSYTSTSDFGTDTTTFDITAVTVVGNNVTISIVTTGEYSGSEQDIPCTYVDGALVSDHALMWGNLTLTKN